MGDAVGGHSAKLQLTISAAPVTHFVVKGSHLSPKQCHQLEAECGSVAHTLPFHGGVGVCRVFHLAWAHSLSPRGDLHSLQGAVPADSLVS